MLNLNYAQAEQALLTANAAVSLAEAHGCLCGALCTLPQFSTQNWLQELLPDPAEPGNLLNEPAVDAALLQIFKDTQLALQGDEMSFAPLLPDDEVAISERIAALAQWSQGFLYGFGIGATEFDPARHPDEVVEVLKDLSEIARADEAETQHDDAEEQAYMELVEYLRAAVQLVYDELAPQRTQRGLQQPLAH